jgi:hypothetical protein
MLKDAQSAILVTSSMMRHVWSLMTLTLRESDGSGGLGSPLFVPS